MVNVSVNAKMCGLKQPSPTSGFLLTRLHGGTTIRKNQKMGRKNLARGLLLNIRVIRETRALLGYSRLLFSIRVICVLRGFFCYCTKPRAESRLNPGKTALLSTCNHQLFVNPLSNNPGFQKHPRG